MNKFKKLILIMTISFPMIAFAQPNQGDTKNNQQPPRTTGGGGGLHGEFDRIQEEIDIPPNQKELDEKQEKKTLLVAMQEALARGYRLKDAHKITENDITVEQHEQNTLLYYVKYKQFIGQFRYKNAPSKYFSLPVESKVLLKPGTKYDEKPSVFKDDKKEQGSTNASNNQNNKPKNQ